MLILNVVIQSITKTHLQGRSLLLSISPSLFPVLDFKFLEMTSLEACEYQGILLQSATPLDPNIALWFYESIGQTSLPELCGSVGQTKLSCAADSKCHRRACCYWVHSRDRLSWQPNISLYFQHPVLPPLTHTITF